MTRQEELVNVLRRRFKKEMNNPDVFESISIDEKELKAVVRFHEGQHSKDAIFEYIMNGNKSYWKCLRDWND